MTVPTLINTGRSGVVYDEAGHSLGGGERIDVDEVDDTTQAAIDNGHLRCEDNTSVPEGTDDEADAGRPGASQPE